MGLEQKTGKSVASGENFLAPSKLTKEVGSDGEGRTPIHQYQYGWTRPGTGQYLSRTALAECQI